VCVVSGGEWVCVGGCFGVCVGVCVCGCLCVCVCVLSGCAGGCTVPQGAWAVRPRQHSKFTTHAHRKRSHYVPTKGDSPANIRDNI